MNITELLSVVSKTASKNGLSEPFIVGGLPRDKVMKRLNEVQDIDLTTGDDSIHKLSELVLENLKSVGADASIKTFPDGHSQINVDGMKLDFSSNYHSKHAERLLKKAGIEPKSTTVELVSRDFTCNTLLLSLDLKRIKDPIGGIKDIQSKILKTPMHPRYTLGDDHKRIIRVIYLAVKLGFEVESSIIEFVGSNPELVETVKDGFTTKKINESLEIDPDKTIKLIDQMKLWPHIPIGEKLIPYASGKI